MGNLPSNLSPKELRAIADAVEAMERVWEALSQVEARPADPVLHIDSEIMPGYLGYIGFGDDGSLTFQPAPPKDDDSA